ncbi:hypothetical protein [Rouxiella sp. WC2420]|uniref:Uncharacterized protein n=1 Tax=Rouxiella sp. WC2420 TaxID=3234145 RepID=A0AB39VXE9_9GAMM
MYKSTVLKPVINKSPAIKNLPTSSTNSTSSKDNSALSAVGSVQAALQKMALGANGHSSGGSQNANSAYDHMVSNGDAWKELNGRGKEAISLLSKSNINKLQSSIPNPLEREFIANFKQQPFYLSHFSSKDVRNKQGSAEFLSRKQLQKKKVSFNTKNTAQLDLDSFATDDFVFFALEVGDNNQKTSSRFGDINYRIPLDAVKDDIKQYGHLEAADLAQNDQRPGTKVPDWVSYDDKDKFFQGDVIDHEIIDLVFYGKDMIEGLAYRIVQDLREFSSATRDKALKMKDSKEVNGLMNSLYRPQVLFPHSLILDPKQFKYNAASNKSSASKAAPLERKTVPAVQHFYV